MARKDNRFWTLPGGRVARDAKRRGGEHNSSAAHKLEPRWRRRQESLADELLQCGLEQLDGEEQLQTEGTDPETD